MASGDTLDQLYADFANLNMEGGWHRRFPALWPEPRRNFLPHVWHYAQVKPILDRAGLLVDTTQAERRNLTMFNPVEGNTYSTVRTIVAAYQMIRPGEIARSHRHTPNALRLILEGRGTYTVVDGTRVEMRPGDVLLTPSMAWHSHANDGGNDCYWMDFLDVPLVHLLEPMFYEPHPDGVEADPTRAEVSPIAFRWEETRDRLDAQQALVGLGRPVAVDLGPPQLASIALRMIRVPAGAVTAPTRTTANNIFAVVRGSGRSEIDGQAHIWSFGDTIAVPAWRPFEHFADEEAVLLQVSDAPVLERLGWLRTQTS
ncbi:cupin domain-containing protein [Sphingomonas sp. AR_OL41]|uniref:cupin domain-containing protein n=1 Tax=Sphingomonas sp. AR_OL41 TaxID=3042729 RepID=UPI002480870E|nr:cupin domain-containing protein [Sphingomonas sp. AR_OL41]MDH7973642.1 cupin domain-containing protein [Sphingomonas sp. AR_OL41]